MRTLLIASAIIVMLSAPAQAASTVEDLRALCIDGYDSSQPYCDGYVIGVVETIHVLREIGMGPPVCFPEFYSHSIGVEVVRAYLRRHERPNDWLAAGIVIEAVGSAWPCR